MERWRGEMRQSELGIFIKRKKKTFKTYSKPVHTVCCRLWACLFLSFPTPPPSMEPTDEVGNLDTLSRNPSGTLRSANGTLSRFVFFLSFFPSWSHGLRQSGWVSHSGTEHGGSSVEPHSACSPILSSSSITASSKLWEKKKEEIVSIFIYLFILWKSKMGNAKLHA